MTGVSFHSRWTHHRRELRLGIHGNPLLRRAWKKYGESAFDFDALECLDHVPENELRRAMCAREAAWLKATPKTYNLTLPGEGGMKATPETSAKLSAIRRLQWADPDFRRKMRVAFVKAQSDPKLRREKGAKISATMLNDPRFRSQRSALTTLRWTEGSLREAQKAGIAAMWEDPERKAKRNAKHGATWAEKRDEWRAGIQAAWDADPVRRAERIAAMRAGQSYPIFDTLLVVLHDASDWLTPQQARVAAGELLGDIPSTQVIWQGLKRLVARGEAEKDGPRYRLKEKSE